MRRTVKKFIISLLILSLLMNFFYGNLFPANAIAAEEVVNVIINIMGGIIGIFTWIPRLVVMALGFGVNVLTAQVGYVDRCC